MLMSDLPQDVELDVEPVRVLKPGRVLEERLARVQELGREPGDFYSSEVLVVVVMVVLVFERRLVHAVPALAVLAVLAVLAAR